VHKLKELKSAEKFSRLLPGEGVISVSELAVMLRSLVTSSMLVKYRALIRVINLAPAGLRQLAQIYIKLV
jgi:hypothetical protein